jgi:uncharacterized protein
MRTEDPDSTLVQALRRQLGAQGQPVELIETHISWVLLAGDAAWKIKKPVRLGFLDFSSLQARRRFCEEELRLNRRYAPSIYREVVAITGTPQAPQWGGSQPAIEFALHMRRFPPRSLLSEKLADGTLQAAHLDALAQRMAAAHRQADVAPPDSPWGRPEGVANAVRDVLARLHEQGVAVSDLQCGLAEQSRRLAPLWEQRRHAGWVRECHGDLHLRNAVVLEDGATAFDGIEFEPSLRWIDVQSDIAFMAMDLMAYRRCDLAWRFLNAWLDVTGDHAGVPVLGYYLCYRALVRALVGRLGGAAGVDAPPADGYLALARRLAFDPPRARLLVTHGLSGSGKTQLTQQLLEHSGAMRLRSDVERKRLYGLGALASSHEPAGPPQGRIPACAARSYSSEHVPGGIYSAGATRRTYAHLEACARLMLQAGYPVIIDAACLRHAEREQLAAMAADAGVPFTLLDCQADAATLRQRVRARRLRGGDASEADEAVLEHQFTIDEPLSAGERAKAIEVRTDRPLDVAAIAARWRCARP